MNTDEFIVTKLFSGRYFATVVIIATYCLAVVGTLLLTIWEKIPVDVFLGLFAGFSTLAGSIITFYFTRADRKQKEPSDV